MLASLLNRAQKYAAHFGLSGGIDCAVLDMASRCISPQGARRHFCSACPGCPASGGTNRSDCKSINPHLYGTYEAYRWGGKYIYYCPAGLIFMASPLMDEGSLEGALIAGPVIMGNSDDILDEGHGVLGRLDRQSAAGLLARIPELSTQRVNSMSEMLYIAAGYVSGGDFAGTEESRARQQGEIYQYIEEIKTKPDRGSYTYPIEIEKRLQALIAQGDKAASQELLNELLGHIFFSSGGVFELIKARVIELIVLLSRASIEGGTETSHAFAMSAGYLRQIDGFRDIDELSMWLSGVMTRFTSVTFDFVDVKHADSIYKAVEYIKANYAGKVSLDDIAAHVYLSKSYLSKIFKDEMKCNISAYINQVRVEKSKLLLLDKSISLVDVANYVGFEDQSYFTKVFKKITGVSPGRYREKRGKPSA